MQTEQELRATMERAMKELQRGLTIRGGGQRYETMYATAYQQLVSMGLEPQLKTRYRNQYRKVVR